MEENTILWRRLDSAGHDACRLILEEESRQLKGAAVFRNKGVPACLSYEVDADKQWHTRRGTVRGWVGVNKINYEISRKPEGVWILNRAVVPDLDGCIDLDFGFTPATNLFQLRRIALQVGQVADVPVAWFDMDAGTLDILHQRYERRSTEIYWYEASRFNYSAALQVGTAGFVEKYPNLWEKER